MRDIVERLRTWAEVIDLTSEQVPLTMLHGQLFTDAADEIERLREALALAVGELSTHGEYAAWTPEMLMNQFLEEARREQ